MTESPRLQRGCTCNRSRSAGLLVLADEATEPRHGCCDSRPLTLSRMGWYAPRRDDRLPAAGCWRSRGDRRWSALVAPARKVRRPTTARMASLPKSRRDAGARVFVRRLAEQPPHVGSRIPSVAGDPEYEVLPWADDTAYGETSDPLGPKIHVPEGSNESSSLGFGTINGV